MNLNHNIIGSGQGSYDWMMQSGTAGKDLQLIRGRGFLYDLSQDSSKKAQLEKAVKKFLTEIKFFNTTCNLIQVGQPAFYNYKTHKFDITKNPGAEKQDLARAKRDYVVECISQFAKMLFPDKAHKALIVSHFLNHKLIKESNAECQYNYIDSATDKDQITGENSLIKFLEKIRDGKFLSQKEKEIKKSNKAEEKGKEKPQQKITVIHSLPPVELQKKIPSAKNVDKVMPPADIKPKPPIPPLRPHTSVKLSTIQKTKENVVKSQQEVKEPSKVLDAFKEPTTLGRFVINLKHFFRTVGKRILQFFHRIFN